MTEDDRLRRFLFEDAPVRGHWVRLSRAWIEAREHQDLSAPAMALLGESLAAAALFSASLKFEGTLTLQLSGGEGGIAMLVAQATDQHRIRGVAHLADGAQVEDDSFNGLVGAGHLVVSVDRGQGAAPWQGIVPLDGDSLATCLEQYFAVSEQVPTALVLAANAEHAGGLLLQKLPGPAGQGEAAAASAQDIWEEATALLATLGADELLQVEPQELLRRLFGTQDLRLFEGEDVGFACRCDRERVAALLRGVGRAEVESIVAEQGAVTVTCEFCQKPYRFDTIDAAQLFMPQAPSDQPPSLN